MANPDDADDDDERSDERDDELAAEQAASDAEVNVMVEALANPDLGPQATGHPDARGWPAVLGPSGRPVPDLAHT